jgi:hypothetical protein
MSRKSLPKRSVLIVLSGAALLLSASPGQGETVRPRDRRACAASYEKAQELRQGSKLRRAKEALASCAKAACGEFVQRECTRWLGQVDSEMPSIVPVAKDPSGAPVLDVQVSMDGELLASRLDGRGIQVDPGMHDFEFRTAVGVVIERRIAIAQGERNRVVSVDVPAPGSSAPPAPRADAKDVKPKAVRVEPAAAARPQIKAAAPAELPPQAPPSKSSSSAVPYLVGGIGVIGLGGYGLFYGLAKKENNAVLTQCWPTCAESRLDRIRNLYLAADVSLGVGIAALGTATYLFLQSGPDREKTATQAAYVVDVVPSRSGAFASVSGVF